MPEEPGLARARREEPSEHLHGRGLAAAVGAQEAEDLAAPDAKAHPIDRHEIPEAHGEIARLDRDVGVVCAGRQRRDHQVAVSCAFFGRQERDERRFQIGRRGTREELVRRAGREDAPRVHRNQRVEALRLVHVGGRDDHAHPDPFGANPRDQVPELAARERIDTRRRFVEDEQIRIVDQRAAQAELLLHAPGELARGALAEFVEARAAREIVDAALALGGVVSEELPEELQVLVDRERRVQVLAEPLRHVGDARAHVLTMPALGHVAAERFDPPRLHDARASDEREERGLAHTIGPDEPERAPGRNGERDVDERWRLAVVMRDGVEPRDGERRGETHRLISRGRSRGRRATPRGRRYARRQPRAGPSSPVRCACAEAPGRSVRERET